MDTHAAQASRIIQAANLHEGDGGLDYVIGDLETAIESILAFVPEDRLQEAVTEALTDIAERQGLDLGGLLEEMGEAGGEAEVLPTWSIAEVMNELKKADTPDEAE